MLMVSLHKVKRLQGNKLSAKSLIAYKMNTTDKVLVQIDKYLSSEIPNGALHDVAITKPKK